MDRLLAGESPLDDQLAPFLAREGLPKSRRIALATEIVEQGLLSQRKAYELTGIARDTIRSHAVPQKRRANGKGSRDKRWPSAISCSARGSGQ